jgi:hypothetical protein
LDRLLNKACPTGGLSNWACLKIRRILFRVKSLPAVAGFFGNDFFLFGCGGQRATILVKGYFVTVIASVSQRSNPLKTKRLLRQKAPRNDCNFIPQRVYNFRVCPYRQRFEVCNEIYIFCGIASDGFVDGRL